MVMLYATDTLSNPKEVVKAGTGTSFTKQTKEKLGSGNEIKQLICAQSVRVCNVLPFAVSNDQEVSKWSDCGMRDIAI